LTPFRDKPLGESELMKFYKKHGFKPINDEGEMSRPAKEKNAGGNVIGGLAGLIARPFVGQAKSQSIQKGVVGNITKYINNPIENGLRRVGVHKAISKIYEHGTRPIPGTPKLFQPVLPDPAQRRAYGQWRADDIVHTVANNPEILASYALPPVPGATSTYLAGKHLLSRALGGGLQKLAEFTGPFSDELEKLAKVNPYQQKTQWTCSAACLKAVLEHWGTKFPELALIDAIGARKGRGAECNEIAEAARKLGFLAFEYSFDSLEQAQVLLGQDIPIICDIQSFNNPGKGHYVVMTRIDENGGVHLMDPNTPGNSRTISEEEMNERWWDRAMAPPNQLMPKWGIVIVPPEGQDGVP
jgi:predicted double-glycine peptidase